MFFTSDYAFRRRRPRNDKQNPVHPPAGVRASFRARTRPNTAARRAAFTMGAAAADATVLVATALLAALVYQQDIADAWDTGKWAGVIAILFVGANLLRHHYGMQHYLTSKRQAERALMSWLAAFGAALTLGFLTKTSALFSRGVMGIFFVAGFAAVMLTRILLVRHMRAKAEAGDITFRTVVLVGAEDEIHAFMTRYRPSQCGLDVVGASVLRGAGASLTEDLALAVATARMLRPDDVFLLVPWGEPEVIANCIDMFRRLPAAIHLGPARFLDRFDDMRIDQAGRISSVHLVRSPLSPLEVAVKRIFDILVSATLLILLSPLLAFAALAIKLDSPGPVLFFQRRYGFNQEPFRILKFRSMSTLEDDARLTQVTPGDTRVTRVGRLLRRTSIDELPQLINVLRGDMSLVGPRPHALAHDQRFERTIALYARRHNVRPGMTGWAQVNGWRGETDTPEKIQGRIEHDLYYIDNWSMWFDLAILLRTAFSPATFRNAK